MEVCNFSFQHIHYPSLTVFNYYCVTHPYSTNGITKNNTPLRHNYLRAENLPQVKEKNEGKNYNP